jgi:choline kinase
MKAIILAAGRGSRMKGLTDERPKCLVEVRGQPLLARQRDALQKAGISEIGIVTGYRSELLDGFGFVAFHNPRWAETNMVTSLGYARAWLEHEPCIISYSDIFYGAEAPAALMASAADVAVTYDPDWLALWRKRFEDPLVDAETFRMAPDGTLTEIGKKPTSVEEVQGQYMGLLRITPDGWREVTRIRADMQPDVRDKMHMTGTLQKVIEAGRVPIAAIPYRGAWGEVDSAEDLAAYQ